MFQRIGSRRVILHYIVIIFILSGCSKRDKETDIDPVARYRLTFTVTWSTETHPIDFPPNPHFSGIIGMVHNEEVSLFYTGEPASDGIKEMAERGSKEPLDSEIETFILNGTASKLISENYIPQSPGQISFEIEASASHSLISIVTMLAPSPDWFVAVSNIQLIENDAWTNQKTVTLSIYDAGTDSGSTYTSANQITSPRENISLIKSPPLAVIGKVASPGTILIEKI